MNLPFFLKETIKRRKILFRLIRKYRRIYYTNAIKYLWKDIINENKDEWNKILEHAKKGPNILIATSVGSFLVGSALESLLGIALTLRGAKISILLCDSVLPACFACDTMWYSNLKKFIQLGPQAKLCKTCFAPANEMFESLGFQVLRFSDFLTNEDINKANFISSSLPLDEIKTYEINNLSVGEHAIAGCLRFLARADLNEKYAGEILRKYFKASLLSVFAMEKLFNKFNFESAVFHHGMYVPLGLIGEVARDKKIRVVNWNVGYRKGTFIFSHDFTYNNTLMTEPVENWQNIKWTHETESKIMTYLKSRWNGSNDWIWFHERPVFDIKSIQKITGIDFSKPTIGMLTNVLWDAQLLYPSNAFSNMLEWVIKTIRYFIKRKDLQLVIRVHPAEIRGLIPTRQPVIKEIMKVFPELPENIHIIPPESHISTYAVMLQCNAIIIYGTKAGVELAAMGIPVIVAGEAWVRNKGITIDTETPDSYFKILDQLPFQSRLDEELTQRARMYAYHFFFRRMIPLEFIKHSIFSDPNFKIDIRHIKELMPGKSKGLDIITNGILHGEDFIYPDELINKT